MTAKREDVEALWELIADWLPPMGMTSIPEDPIKPAQANALHAAVRTLKACLEQAERESRLGCATTAELITELQARAEVGGYANYRTWNPVRTGWYFTGQECPYCDGRGWNTIAVHNPADPDGEPLPEREQCATCGGSGAVSTEGEER